MKHLIIIFCGLIPFLAFGQSFNNSSFEGEPQDATIPIGWFACTKITTPDILPGPWGVYTEASEGETFVGLITRQGGTWEAIGQRVKKTLKAGQCYAFSVDLAKSETYSGYNGTVRFRVWAGSRKCGKDQLISLTDPIDHEDWKTYNFQFTADKKVKYIYFEAYHADEQNPKNGNVLIDKITAIKSCSGV